MTGALVVLEGLDAAGKDTIGEWLAHEVLEAELFRFPDRTTPYGKVIQAHLDRAWCVDVSAVDAMVFQACHLTNRLEVAPRIEAARIAGRDVVAVRYTPSSVVYGAVDGLDFDYMVEVQRALPQPDVSILLDVDYETSCARRPERRDRYEAKGQVFYDALRDGYHKLWAEASQRNLGGRWAVVDARRPLAEVQAQVLEVLSAA